MVLIKAIICGETRRFTLSDKATYDELREKIASIFPSLTDKAKSLVLSYRDHDGDIVSVSSDEEVAVAIATVPPNGTWKVAVQLSTSPKKTPLSFKIIPLFLDLLDPDTSPLLSEWDRCGSSCDLLKKRAELLEKLKKNSKETTKEKKNTDESRETTQKVEDKDEPEVKSKNGTTNRSAFSSLWGDLEEALSGLPINTYGTPLMREVAIGPTGFEMTWKWVHESKCKDEAKKKDEEEAARGVNETPSPAGQPLEEQEESGEVTVSQDVPPPREVPTAED